MGGAQPTRPATASDRANRARDNTKTNQLRSLGAVQWVHRFVFRIHFRFEIGERFEPPTPWSRTMKLQTPSALSGAA
jgi:hypothetical protein